MSRLTVALAFVVAALGATATSAGAWTLSAPSGGSLKAAPTTESQFFVSVTVGSDGKVHFAPAAETPTLAAACSNSGGETVCPTSALATKLEIDQALGASVSGITTGTLQIVGTSKSDQWSLSNVTISGTLDVDPGGGGADQLNASGKAGLMQLDNTTTDHGTIALTLDTGPTGGTIQLPSGHNNYVYAPDSMLNVTGDGSITAGGALNGGAGNDSFHAVSTTQVINGGGGQDAVTFTRVSAPLTLALQGDNVLLNGDTSPHVVGVQDVTGGSGNDTLIGSAPPGGSGPLTLRGGPGNNIFVPMGGPENIIGAPGNTMNTVSYAYLPDSTPLTVDLSNGTGGPTGASDQQDSLTNIQGVIGNNGTDNITGGSQGGSFMLGNGATTMTGGPENDTIQAGSGTDNINGGGGNDTILGGSGNDTLVGGPGNNHIQAGSGTTVLEDSGGDNTLVGGSGNDTVSYANRTRDQGVIVSLNGTAGSSNNGQPGENDTITGIENIIGSAGDDILNGDSNANNIQAGSGNPVINGGDGNDTIVGGSGNDTITDGKGVDTITTGNGDNLVTANSAPGSVLNCGSGFNNVTVSTSVVTNNCQLVTILGEKAFVPPPTLINASLGKVSARKFKEGFTIFKRLDVDNVPGQTSVSITCQTLSNLCPKNNPAAYNFNSGKRTVHLIKFLKSISYEVPGKTTLTILVTGGPNTIGREFVIKTGKHGGVQKTIQTCLKPRTVESAATTTTGFSTSGGGLKTQKCPPKAAFDSNRAVRANARRHTRPETQQQRQQADATFALATAQIRALAARDAAALALVK